MLIQTITMLFLMVIATCTAYIAYKLYLADQEKAKTGLLYEKRLGVYREVVRLLSLITRDGDVSNTELLAFRSKTHEAQFLFDKTIADYIDEIYYRSTKLRSTNERMKSDSLPIGEERDGVTVENSKQLIWLADQLPLLKNKFEFYLDLQVLNSSE